METMDRSVWTSGLPDISATLVIQQREFHGHLHPAPPNKELGPFQSSENSYIKLSFKEHGQIEPGRIRAVGIVGIERKLEEKRKETDKNISESLYPKPEVQSVQNSEAEVYGFG